MANLPYITATGNIEKALKGIKSAATPERVSQDFVKTILRIQGGSGNQITSFLKKIGFASTDGTPTDIYKRFRSSDPKVSGQAAADSLRFGYAPLYTRNEYMHKLTDEELRGLIIEETGQSAESATITMISSSIKALKAFANWSAKSAVSATDPLSEPDVSSAISTPVERPPLGSGAGGSGIGMNLSYTINLNLPATSDQPYSMLSFGA